MFSVVDGLSIEQFKKEELDKSGEGFVKERESKVEEVRELNRDWQSLTLFWERALASLERHHDHTSSHRLSYAPLIMVDVMDRPCLACFDALDPPGTM
jgi:hypothetical protein